MHMNPRVQVYDIIKTQGMMKRLFSLSDSFKVNFHDYLQAMAWTWVFFAWLKLDFTCFMKTCLLELESYKT